eukprot:COSAG06_NODE_27414_length_593_cov_6.655870_1_plen_97_part_10
MTGRFFAKCLYLADDDRDIDDLSAQVELSVYVYVWRRRGSARRSARPEGTRATVRDQPHLRGSQGSRAPLSVCLCACPAGGYWLHRWCELPRRCSVQ